MYGHLHASFCMSAYHHAIFNFQDMADVLMMKKPSKLGGSTGIARRRRRRIVHNESSRQDQTLTLDSWHEVGLEVQFEFDLKMTSNWRSALTSSVHHPLQYWILSSNLNLTIELEFENFKFEFKFVTPCSKFVQTHLVDSCDRERGHRMPACNRHPLSADGHAWNSIAAATAPSCPNRKSVP